MLKTTKENLIARNQTAADRIVKINQRLEKAGSNKALIEELNFQKEKLTKEMQKNESALEVTPSEAAYKTQAGEDSFFPRFWNKNKITTTMSPGIRMVKIRLLVKISCKSSFNIHCNI